MTIFVDIAQAVPSLGRADRHHRRPSRAALYPQRTSIANDRQGFYPCRRALPAPVVETVSLLSALLRSRGVDSSALESGSPV